MSLFKPKQVCSRKYETVPGKSRKALLPVAEYLGTDVEQAADKMIQVALANMYTELSNVMEQHGFDPREFSLMAFGGAGPVTANFWLRKFRPKCADPAASGNSIGFGRTDG